MQGRCKVKLSDIGATRGRWFDLKAVKPENIMGKRCSIVGAEAFTTRFGARVKIVVKGESNGALAAVLLAPNAQRDALVAHFAKADAQAIGPVVLDRVDRGAG
jgi:hypothetical protein